MDKVLQEYYEKFGEFPPLIQTMFYEEDMYQNLMKKAIKNGRPIGIRDVNLELDIEGLQPDIAVGKTDEDIYNEGLKHRLGED